MKILNPNKIPTRTIKDKNAIIKCFVEDILANL